MTLRISLVHYLNAAPLGWKFLHGPCRDQFVVVPSSPAACADRLASGDADLGIIPSIEYQRIPNLRLIPGVAIGAISRVRSVILIRKRGQKEIRSVALDTSSRTSVALITVLLHRKLGLFPEFVPHVPDAKEMLRKCDAALIIGDPALQASPDEFDIMDLAAEWTQWQDRPFVFAVWACRADADLPADLADIFQEARDWGLARRREIAEEYSRRLCLPRQFLEDYLQYDVDYTLSSRHIEGLERFYSLAHQEGLIPQLKPLRFVCENPALA